MYSGFWQTFPSLKQPSQNGWLEDGCFRLSPASFLGLPDCLFSGAFAMTFGVVGSVGWYGEVEGNQKKSLEHRIETNKRIQSYICTLEN